MRARAALMLFAAAVFLSLAAGRAEACSCVPTGPPCQAFSTAAAVFAGVATEIVNAQDTPDELGRVDRWTAVRVRFVVEEPLSGDARSETFIYTSRGGGSCGYRFRQGERYLVYAYRHGETNLLSTSICTRTRPLAAAQEDLDFLRGLSRLQPGATIYGKAHRYPRGFGRRNSEPGEPLPEIVVTLESEGRRRETRTDAEGRYRLSGLAPGKYRVNLTLPDELLAYSRAQEVTVADRGCAVVDFYVIDNGRVSGRVTDAQGQPVAGMLVEVIPQAEEEMASPFPMSVETNEEGRYQFTGLPPGSYLLQALSTRRASPSQMADAYPRTYYPGMADSVEAAPIVIGAGEHAAERNLRMLPRLRPLLISGAVVMRDGSPVPNAQISFRDITYRTDSNYAIAADEQGHFTINVYDGLTYVIRAFVRLPDGREMQAEPVELLATGVLEPIRLVLSEPNGSCSRCPKW